MIGDITLENADEKCPTKYNDCYITYHEGSDVNYVQAIKDTGSKMLYRRMPVDETAGVFLDIITDF